MTSDFVIAPVDLAPATRAALYLFGKFDGLGVREILTDGTHPVHAWTCAVDVNVGDVAGRGRLAVVVVRSADEDGVPTARDSFERRLTVGQVVDLARRKIVEMMGTEVVVRMRVRGGDVAVPSNHAMGTAIRNAGTRDLELIVGGRGANADVRAGRARDSRREARLPLFPTETIYDRFASVERRLGELALSNAALESKVDVVFEGVGVFTVVRAILEKTSATIQRRVWKAATDAGVRDRALAEAGARVDRDAPAATKTGTAADGARARAAELRERLGKIREGAVSELPWYLFSAAWDAADPGWPRLVGLEPDGPVVRFARQRAGKNKLQDRCNTRVHDFTIEKLRAYANEYADAVADFVRDNTCPTDTVPDVGAVLDFLESDRN